MFKRVIIIGAGGHAKVIAEIVEANNDRVVGFLDDNDELIGKRIYSNKKVIGKLRDIGKYKNYYFIIGIGSNEIRKKIALNNKQLKWYKAVHPKANVSKRAKVGKGTVIMPAAIINIDVIIGQHCIINSGAIVEHDSVLNDFVHVSPNATLCGTVEIGENSHIGAGAVIKNNINIVNNCVIGVGAAVVKNIEQEGIYIGVPTAKKGKK